MGLIREPKGVDFIVAPSVLTDKDRKMISEIIADYKKTGKLPPKQKPRKRISATYKKNISANGTKTLKKSAHSLHLQNK